MLNIRETIALVAALAGVGMATLWIAPTSPAQIPPRPAAGGGTQPSPLAPDGPAAPITPTGSSNAVVRTVDPGPLASEVRTAVAAFNIVGAGIRLRVVAPYA